MRPPPRRSQGKGERRSKHSVPETVIVAVILLPIVLIVTPPRWRTRRWSIHASTQLVEFSIGHADRWNQNPRKRCNKNEHSVSHLVALVPGTWSDKHKSELVLRFSRIDQGRFHDLGTTFRLLSRQLHLNRLKSSERERFPAKPRVDLQDAKPLPACSAYWSRIHDAICDLFCSSVCPIPHVLG